LWKNEFIKNTDLIKSTYGEDKELYLKEKEIARSEYRRLRKEEIRNKGKSEPIESELGDEKKTMWQNHHRDQDIWDEIEKDVKRTRTEMEYFLTPLDN